jgi:prolyl oligopeptidase
VREDTKVAAWVAQQNALTDSYLATLPGRGVFEQRPARAVQLRALRPAAQGEWPLFLHPQHRPSEPECALRPRRAERRAAPADRPNTWSQDGATALGEWVPAEDGKRLLYSVQEGGTDWRVVRVIDVDTGRQLPDEVKWVKFSNLAWAKDGSGFFYSRFPEPKPGQVFQSLNENHAVYFHRLGTPQAQDRLVFAQPQRPKLSNVAQVSEDGRWLIITSSEGTDDRYEITLIDLRQPNAQPRRFIQGLENNWSYVGNVGDTFYWVTNKDAPRLRLVSTDISRPTPEVKELIAQDEAVLDGVSLVGGRLIASYLVDAKTEVRTYDLAGKQLGKVELPGIGTAGGFGGENDDPETFYAFTSFNVPASVYRYDARTGQTSVFAQPQVAFSSDDFKVSQRFYRSKDGTRVPIFIVHRKDLDMSKRHPTLLYGYGGFNASMLPGFSAARMAWMEQGRRLRHGQHPRRWRIWQGVARCRPSGQQAERIRRFHRRGRVPGVRRDHLQGQARRPGRLQRRPAGRRRDQPAPRSVRGGAAGGGRDGYAALRPLDGRPLLGGRLWLSQSRGRLPHLVGLFALSQHPLGRRLSGGAGDDRGHR